MYVARTFRSSPPAARSATTRRRDDSKSELRHFASSPALRYNCGVARTSNAPAIACPRRPEAQDAALSRLKHGFESRRGRHSTREWNERAECPERRTNRASRGALSPTFRSLARGYATRLSRNRRYRWGQPFNLVERSACKPCDRMSFRLPSYVVARAATKRAAGLLVRTVWPQLGTSCTSFAVATDGCMSARHRISRLGWPRTTTARGRRSLPHAGQSV
jgi:hypothetical protein